MDIEKQGRPCFLNSRTLVKKNVSDTIMKRYEEDSV